MRKAPFSSHSFYILSRHYIYPPQVSIPHSTTITGLQEDFIASLAPASASGFESIPLLHFRPRTADIGSCSVERYLSFIGTTLIHLSSLFSFERRTDIVVPISYPLSIFGLSQTQRIQLINTQPLYKLPGHRGTPQPSSSPPVVASSLSTTPANIFVVTLR